MEDLGKSRCFHFFMGSQQERFGVPRDVSSREKMRKFPHHTASQLFVYQHLDTFTHSSEPASFLLPLIIIIIIMPCLILTGHPCAGKTTLAKLIAERAKSQFSIDTVTIINEASACPDQSIGECYATSQTEKATRGALKSAVDRAMADASSSSSQHLVILDSLNYIKGFRYELHCISKAAQQQHGVVWVLNSLQQAKAWNQARQTKAVDDNKPLAHQDCYSDELWEALVQRYEPPDERNRWDKPLYPINVQPDQEGAQETEALAKSVYNMHDLSAVLTAPSPTTLSSTDTPNSATRTVATTNTTTATVAPPKKAPKARFKRAKKPVPATANAPTTSIAASTSPPQQPSQSSSSGPILTDTNADSSADSNNSTTATNNQKPPRKSVEEQVDEMLKDFLQSSKLQQGMSTQQFVAHENADILHLVDGVSQHICRAIQREAQPTPITNNTLTISVTLPRQAEATALQVDVRLCSPSNKGHLAAWRRQYMKWTALHPPSSSSIPEMAQAFCDYLQAQIPK